MTVFLPQVVKGRLIVFDPHGEYTDPALIRCDSLGDLKDFLENESWAKHWAIVWTPDNADEIPYFLSLCYAMRDCWLIIEECNMSGLGNVRDADKNFINLVNFGRNRNVSMICTAKRAAQVHRDLTSQADIIISFKQDEPNDIKYLKEFCGPGVENQVMNLHDHDWAVVYPNIEDL